MNKEFPKFRGVRKSDGEIVYGDLHHVEGRIYIVNELEGWEVEPDRISVCLNRAKNGVEIWLDLD